MSIRWYQAFKRVCRIANNWHYSKRAPGSHFQTEIELKRGNSGSDASFGPLMAQQCSSFPDTCFEIPRYSTQMRVAYLRTRAMRLSPTSLLVNLGLHWAQSYTFTPKATSRKQRKSWNSWQNNKIAVTFCPLGQFRLRDHEVKPKKDSLMMCLATSMDALLLSTSSNLKKSRGSKYLPSVRMPALCSAIVISREDST